jgi:hypothetical protein
MNVYEKIKNWVAGNAGHSQLSHLQENAFTERCSMETVESIITKFESDVKSIEDKFPKNLTCSTESDTDLSDLVESMSACINNMPEPAKFNSSDAVTLETRSLEEVINEYDDKTGCALIANGKIVNINEAFFKAVCTGSIAQNADTFKEGVEILKILPKEAVAKLRSYFAARYFNTEISVSLKTRTYIVLLDEFVKDGTCYRKIIVRNII